MNRFPPPFPRPTRSAAALRRLSVAAVLVLPITACQTANDDTTAASDNATTTAADDDATTAADDGTTTVGTDPWLIPSPAPGGGIVVEGPGTGSVPFAGAEDVKAAVSLPAGWYTWQAFVLKKDTDPLPGLALFDAANIYSDPCQWVLLDPPVGPTVDDLAEAFQESTVFDTTPASDVTLDGYPGKYIEVTVPDYDEESCLNRNFGLFKEDGSAGTRPNWYAQAPQQTILMWILDVDGTRLVVSAGHYPHTPDQDRQALTDMVATLDIE